MRRVHGLQIDQNLAFQQREWRVQRFGWWLLTAFVAAAALGLFGNGLLSRARARSDDGRLSVEYERFVRVGAPTRVIVRTTGISHLDVQMDREYFESFAVERITPEPAKVEIAGSSVHLTFEAGSGGAFTALFEMEPLHFGRRRTTLQVTGVQAVRIAQLAYF